MLEDRPPTVAPILPIGAPDAVRQAVSSQDVPVSPARSVPRLFSAAAWDAEPASWLWLLDGSAAPRPDALRRLLEAAVTAGALRAPRPVLLASKVLADGAVDDGRCPWYRRGRDTDLAMRAARLALLPVRAARASSLLVLVQAAVATGDGCAGLAGPGAAMEWTGRLLRDGGGFLAPASVADALAPAPWSGQAVGRGAREDLRVTAAMLAGPGWRKREKLWLALEAAARAAGSLKERAAAARPR
jgi:hypothetical protein